MRTYSITGQIWIPEIGSSTKTNLKCHVKRTPSASLSLVKRHLHYYLSMNKSNCLNLVGNGQHVSKHVFNLCIFNTLYLYILKETIIIALILFSTAKFLGVKETVLKVLPTRRAIYFRVVRGSSITW